MFDPIVLAQCQVVLTSCRNTTAHVVGMYVQRQQTKRDVVRALLLVWCFFVSSSLKAQNASCVWRAADDRAVHPALTEQTYGSLTSAAAFPPDHATQGRSPGN